MQPSAMPRRTTFLREDGEDRPDRAAGIAVVVLVHVVLAYALVSGLPRHPIDLVGKPVVATIVREVKVAPPPPAPAPSPPPPRQIKPVEPRRVQAPPRPAQAAPAPSIPAPPAPAPAPPAPDLAPPAVASPAGELAPLAASRSPPRMEPPNPAPAPATPPAPARMDIAVACPQQVKPEVPQRAINAGVSGVVRAQVRIQSGRVVDVAILSGPRVFHDSVRRALMQYRCTTTGDTAVVATQEFRFEVE